MAEEGVLSSSVSPVSLTLTCPQCLPRCFQGDEEESPRDPPRPGPAPSGQPVPGAQVAITGNTNLPSVHMSYWVGQGNRARRAR